MTTPFSRRLAEYQQRIDRFMPTQLPPGGGRLHEAMRYALTNGGKRVRPFLCYATGLALGEPLTRLDVPACALEMMHAYSLVHDDLPAMDDDDLRRGMPTCHVKYDEATAILAGDALQALSFSVLAHNPDPSLSAAIKLDMVRLLGEASGADGMAAGQAIDLEAVGCALDLEQLEAMHRLKTGALIRASVGMGRLCAGDRGSDLQASLDAYAAAVGLCFQIVDDILDVVSDTQTLGKTQGADIALNKPTYPALLGLDMARQHAARRRDEALDALSGLGASFDELRALAHYIVDRSN